LAGGSRGADGGDFGFGADGRSYVEMQRTGVGETARSVVLVGFQVEIDEICPAL
jgi:hypothetical protein